MKATEGKQRFALRKLSIGTVSVLVGILAFGFSASDQVKADSGNTDNQPQVVNQVAQQPSQKAAESQLQSTDHTAEPASSKQQPADQPSQAAGQQTTNNKQPQTAQQPAVKAKEPSSKPVAADPVTETKTITRTVSEIRFTLPWNSPSHPDDIRTVYTANYKRTKTVGTNGQAVYSNWIPDGSNVVVYDLTNNSQVSESTNMLDVENGKYIFPAYVPEGAPSRLLKPGSPEYKAIVNYTTGKNADGSYKWVNEQPLSGNFPGETVDPNTAVDSQVEIEYLAGFDTNSSWVYNRTIYDLNPATGHFDTIYQGTNQMNFSWQEDPRKGETGQYVFNGGSVPEYVPKHATKYTPYLYVAKGKNWQAVGPITSLPTKTFSNFDHDILPEEDNFKHGQYFNAWTETYEIVYVEPKTDTKPVKETIHYVYENGKKAHDDNVQTVNLTKTYQVLVYGQTPLQNPDSIEWSTSQFDAVQSPKITGYTPDVAEVAASNVDGNSKDAVITVTYKKNAPTDVSQSKTVTETIHYVYSNGGTASPDVTKIVTLTRNGQKDAVTGDVTWGDWSTASIPEVDSPVIEGYTADKLSVAAVHVTSDTPSQLDVTVTYRNNSQPSKPKPSKPTPKPNNSNPTQPQNPTKPNPTQPTQPQNPTEPTQPKGQTSETPKTPDQPTAPTQPKGQTSETPKTPDQPAEPTAPTQPQGQTSEPIPAIPDTPTDNIIPETPAEPVQPVAQEDQGEPQQQPKQHANKLPQTGNSNSNNVLSILGIAVASGLAMLGLGDKRQHD